MTIEAKFFSSDIADKLRGGAYELPDGATASVLMEKAFSEAGIDLPEEKRNNFVFVFNNSPAYADTVLKDGGKLRVMFKITGG